MCSNFCHVLKNIRINNQDVPAILAHPDFIEMCIRDRSGRGAPRAPGAGPSADPAAVLRQPYPERDRKGCLLYTSIDRFAGLDRAAGEELGIEISVQAAKAALPYADGFYPVSYTHLDVYKRQV